MEIEDYTYVQTTWGFPKLRELVLVFCKENPGYIPLGGPVYDQEDFWYQFLVKYKEV